MASHIGRRKFLATLGGAAAWPLVARAQQPAMPVIGFLNARGAEGSTHLVSAFRRGLAENGYIEGQNVEVEYAWANGQYGRLPAIATNFVRRPVSVLVATGGEQAALAAKSVTSTIPIVFAVGSDPVALGLVASYNRPGGNVTGVNILTAKLEAKRLGLLRDLVPQAMTVGALLNPDFPTATEQLSELQEAARGLGLEIQVLPASSDQQIEAVFQSVAINRIPALTVTSNPFFATRRDQLVALAARVACRRCSNFANMRRRAA
jgi:putative tryptophan/tyrosine transport system substrate-binding protein